MNTWWIPPLVVIVAIVVARVWAYISYHKRGRQYLRSQYEPYMNKDHKT